MSTPNPDSVITEVPLDQNGHFLTELASVRMMQLGEYPPIFLDSHLQCYSCALRPVFVLENGTARVTQACTMPEGHTSVVTLRVPSGKLIVSDDLRPVYRVSDDVMLTLEDYNTHLGQTQYVQEMAKLGCAYGPVRNTSPSLYRTGADTYVIASPAYELDEDGMECDPVLPGEELASICTDLWAYSIADYEDWILRGGDPLSLGWTDTVVEVTPGTYRFTHHTGERGFEYETSGAVVFAHIERIE